MLVCSGAANAAIYKCTDVDGNVVFQDQPRTETESEVLMLADPKVKKPSPEHEESDRNAQTASPISSGPAEFLTRSERYLINPADSSSDAWLDAVARVETFPAAGSGTGQLSIVRVFIEDPEHNDQIQAQATKLMSLAERYGGGSFRNLKNGDFLVLEHVNNHHRQNNRDPLALASTRHGRAEVMIPVPEPGTIQAYGDITLSKAPCSELATLQLNIDNNGVDKQVSSIRLGPITVGGPYGEKFICNDPGFCEIDNIAPGPYWLLFDRFNPAQSRWELNLETGEILEMNFEIMDRSTIQRISAGS